MDDAKTELLTPLLKAGVPLVALSLAALIYAGIIAKKSLFTALLNRRDQADSPQTNDSQQGVEPDEKDEEQHNGNNPSLEQEIIGLRSQVEGLHKRESDLRQQFDRYCDMKDRESVLMQVMNLLSLETAHVESLEKEISFMKAENRKLEGFLVQYARIIEQLDGCKSQNTLLRGRIKKLQRKSNAQSRVIEKQSLKIKASEAEILENRDALQTKIDMINQVQNQVRELHSMLEELQNEKTELVRKLDDAEKSYASKVEELEGSNEEYKKLEKEMKKLKEERNDEAEEVVGLRWMNACLRHELEKQQEQQKNKEREQSRKERSEESDGVTATYETEPDSAIGKDDPTMACFGGVRSDGVISSKNKKLMRGLKRWVKGSDKSKVSPMAIMDKDHLESHTSIASDKDPLPT